MWSVPFRRRHRSIIRPHDTRIYAIGDIHGRLDLLASLVRLIERDADHIGRSAYQVVILGDFIDRGPDSKRLIDLFERLSGEPNFITLQGNHEATMVDAYCGDYSAMDMWLEHGGFATLESLGVDTEQIDPHDTRELMMQLRQACPRATIDWLASLPRSVQIGRYYFVHAGIKPGIPVVQQVAEDQLWIRDEFTANEAEHGVVVIHGHTIYEDGICYRPNRIGVDTGAYRTGRLSALALEGGRAWPLWTGEPQYVSREERLIP